MNKAILPKPLHKGSKVALLAPSGPLPEGRLDKAVEAVKAYGLDPVIYESAECKHGYLAGHDAIRANDLNRAFADDSIEGVLCLRGGYGAQKLHKLLDWDVIKANPKVFCGYSDITYLHGMMNTYCNFVTYHTPMPSTEWYHGLDEYTDKWLRKALFGGEWGELDNCEGEKRETIAGGKAKGKLLGGNLSLVSSAVGTPYEISGRDAIWFLEDIGEQPYRVDGMLNHMMQAGSFDGCKGIVLGYYTDCKAKDPDRSLTLREIFCEILRPLGVPVLAGMSCGHAEPTLSLPLGMLCEVDADAQTLRIVEE